jgi:hypothetical protein
MLSREDLEQYFAKGEPLTAEELRFHYANGDVNFIWEYEDGNGICSPYTVSWCPAQSTADTVMAQIVR